MTNVTIPYTYLLHHKPTDTWYYGAKWKQGCRPEDFWITYFSSSKRIKILRDQYGDDSFEFEIRRTFKPGKSASIWESKVLRRMKVLQKSDKWLNKTTNSAWLYDVHPLLGTKIPGAGKHLRGLPIWNKGLTKETDLKLAKISEKQKERLTGKPNPKHSKRMKDLYLNGLKAGMSGKNHSAESNEKNRLAHLGKEPTNKGKKLNRYWITNGVDNKRIHISDTLPLGWRAGRIV